MDVIQALSALSAGGSLLLVLTLSVLLWRQVNHTRCVSRCCGRRFDASVDVGRSPYAAAVIRGTELPPSPERRGSGSAAVHTVAVTVDAGGETEEQSPPPPPPPPP